MGRYIHKVCVKYGELERKGFYYGLFSTLFITSSIVGALLVIFGLDFLTHYQYFMVVAGLAVLSCIFCLVFVEDVKMPDEEKKPDIKQQLKNMREYYWKMRHMLGYTFIDGINVAVSILTILHLYQPTGERHTDEIRAGIALLAMGFGGLVGGYLGGKLCDIFGVKKVAYAGIALYALTCILSIVVSLVGAVPFSCVACFAWGFLLYYIQANEMVMCSKLFEGKYESFAVMKQFHLISVILFYVVSLLTENSIPVKYLMSVLVLLAIPALWLLAKLPERKETLLSIVTEEGGE